MYHNFKRHKLIFDRKLFSSTVVFFGMEKTRQEGYMQGTELEAKEA